MKIWCWGFGEEKGSYTRCRVTAFKWIPLFPYSPEGFRRVAGRQQLDVPADLRSESRLARNAELFAKRRVDDGDRREANGISRHHVLASR